MKVINKIKCFFNYHYWEMTSWIMPYRKKCQHCKKEMMFIGYNIWMESE